MKQSAGLLVFRHQGSNLEVLLAHPGGPFWSHKDSWSIPKGEVEAGEELSQAADREFSEETGLELPKAQRLDLGSLKQGSDKVNFIWAVEGNPDALGFVCRSTFTMEWPPKSGQLQEFPENDKLVWFDIATAKLKIFKAQQVFLDRLAEQLHLNLPVMPEQQALL